jgi:tetratricopeptide (TPR) repeat protein
VRWQPLALALLFALVAGAYAPSLVHPFIYDDHPIMRELRPRSLGDVAKVFTRQTTFNLPYFRPVSRVTISLQRFLHGDDPAPYHAVNALLIGAASLLVYALLRLPCFAAPPAVALLGGALFGLHPVASCVVYPFSSGRETLIPALWMIASVYAFLRGGRRWYALALLCLALALFAKEQAIVTPVLLALADWLGLSRDAPGRNPRRWAARHAPVMAVTLGYLVARWVLFGGAGEHRIVLFENPSGPLWSVLYALQVVFAPFVELHYQPRRVVWFDPLRLVAVAALVSLLAAALRWRWAQVGVRARFWIGWFLIAMAPTANILAQEVRYDERWVFVSLLGVIGVLAALASAEWSSTTARRLSLGLGLPAVLACAAITVQRAATFASDDAFVEQWLRSDADSVHAQYLAGETRAAAGDLPEAEWHYRRALEIDPEHAVIHMKLANLLLDQGRKQEASEEYFRALQLDRRFSDPSYDTPVRR